MRHRASFAVAASSASLSQKPITMQKMIDIAEKVIGIDVSVVKETSKEIDSRIRTGDNLIVQPERKKIPFPVNPNRKLDMKKHTEHSEVDSTEKESIIKQIKAEQKPVSDRKSTRLNSSHWS